MSDLFSTLASASWPAIAWIAIMAGMGGSLHCIGMCGGLVTACAPDRKSIVTYQFGRLGGYLLLGIFSGTLGSLINLQKTSSWISIVPSVALGGVLIYWGLASWRGKRAELPIPKWFSKVHSKIWQIILPRESEPSNMRPAGVGLFSIFLPCGLLYAVVLSTMTFQNPLKGAFAMFFFWLGTVPAMGVAPQFIKTVLNKIMFKSPKLAGVSFMTIGLLTIGWRVYAQIQASSTSVSCH